MNRIRPIAEYMKMRVPTSRRKIKILEELLELEQEIEEGLKSHLDFWVTTEDGIKTIEKEIKFVQESIERIKRELDENKLFLEESLKYVTRDWTDNIKEIKE